MPFHRDNVPLKLAGEIEFRQMVIILNNNENF